jgi:DNA polymerase-3 subunit delta'
MIYSNLLINNKNWNHLGRTWFEEKMPHALLFHGPEGSGKEGHALELAALIQCNSKKSNESCGQCISCKKTKALNHNNIKLIIPLPRGKIQARTDSIDKAFSESALQEYWTLLKKKKEDPYFSIKLKGANTILINSVRSLKQELSLNSINDAWKVILIFEAEKLCIPNTESANSILKILEEPPENTLFILVSSHPGSILDTIHSRCQNIYFPSICNEELTKYLIELGNDPIQSNLMARISNGNVKLSKKLILDTKNIMEKLFVILNACFTNDPIIWNKCIDIMSRQKKSNIKEMEHLFICLMLFFRDLLYYSKTKSTNKIIFKNKIEKIEYLSQLYLNAKWDICIEHIENTQNYIIRNGHLPLQITNMLINIKKSLNGKDSKVFQLSDWTLL